MSIKLRKKSGVAMILVMVALAFMAIIIVEIVAASRVDLRIAVNARNRTQAQYLALSAAKLSILRLQMYIALRNMADAGTLPVPKDMADKLWNVPFPPLPFASSESTWPGQMMSSIESEGGKIPINLIDGNRHRNSGKSTRETVIKEIEGLINGLLQTDEFDKNYRGLEAKDLINPLIDWIDSDNVMVEGGDEAQGYDKLEPPYGPRNDRIPSVSELHMVQGWTDDLIQQIASNFSVIKQRTDINPNYLSRKRLLAWGPRLSPEDLQVIEERKRTQPFASLEDLESFIRSDPNIKEGKDFTIPEELKKNSSDREVAFKIEASGIVGDARRGLRLGVIISEEKPKKNNQKNPDGSPKAPKPGKLLEPQVVFVEEYL